MHWAVSGSAGSGRVAAAGLCLVLREAERAGTISQHGGQSESLPGEASQSDEQQQEQSPGPHRSAGGTRCLRLFIFDVITLVLMFQFQPNQIVISQTSYCFSSIPPQVPGAT